MRIEKIEAIGFKSFSDKVEIIFQPGITAVVGPNGCGKSNISDAISWVLGEQSAKHLRGKKMEDVIYNGTESRKSMSMAEVTLTVSNDNGNLNSIYKDFKEIMITRRLYRSGESEYYINKTLCRLKDIHELFLDTGVGAKACSIIKQGEVSELLTSHAEQRRSLIEEAAGIEKYQMRKKETERKLEHTKDNLVKLDLIISEVKKQVNSLVRQARKAKVYNKFQEKISEFEIKIAALKLKKLEENYKPLEESFLKFQDEKIGKSSKLMEFESKFEEIKLDIMQREEELRGLQEGFHEKDMEVSGIRARIELLEKEVSHMNDIKSKARDDINILNYQMDEFKRELSEREIQKDEIRNALASRKDELSEKEKNFECLKKDVSAKLDFIEAQKNKIVELITEISTTRNIIQEGDIRLEDLNRRMKSQGEEKEKESFELDEIEKKISEISEEMGMVNCNHSKVTDEINSLISELGDKENKLLSLEKEMKDVNDTLTLKKSDLSSLKKILDSHEGFDRGVKAILKEIEARNDEWCGVLGTLSDFIETTQGYEVAIEAVLKDRLQNIIVESQSEALRALVYLKNSSEGRSSFLPLKPKQPASAGLHEVHEVPKDAQGLVGRAVDFIKYPENFSHLANYLLSDVIVVDSFENAYELWKNNGNGFSYVSLSGDIIAHNGAISGGATDILDHGLLMKKREAKELEQEINVLTGKKEKLEKICHELKENILNDKAKRENLEKELREIQVRQVHLTKDLEVKIDGKRRVNERIEQIAFEIDGLFYEKEEIEKDLKSFHERLALQEEAKRSVEGNLNNLQEELGVIQDRLEKEREKLTELKVCVARDEEEEKRIEFQIETLKSSLNDVSDRISKENLDINDADKKIFESDELIGKTKSELETKLKEGEEIKENLTLKRTEMEGILYNHNNLEAEIRVIRKEHEALNQELNEIDKQKTEISIEINNLNKALTENYLKTADEAKSLIAEGDDLNLIQEELQKFKSRREKIGLVNLGAISEYEEQKKRLDFLETQKKDLVDSSDSLKKAISTINKTSKERFIETFNIVNEKFREVFQLFFSGGEAELRLIDEANPLETGIEIVAQPPGKRLQNVSLLSGGEKALTFISLLFSVFLIKPSPFCLLDEVDAPLDEANLMRLTNFIKKLSDKTQFLVITHANRTMATADVLYGITMEEAGVTKIVSVKLKEEESKEIHKQKVTLTRPEKFKPAALTA